MQPIEIRPNVYWVGAIDWNLRYFHGYLTPRGSTYNAYLIMDEKITLVDTVKRPFAGELLDRIKKLVDPERIDYMVVNHVEMDHSGSVPEIMSIAPKAKIITSPNGKKGLERYYKTEWDYQVVNTGDELKLGAYTLKFVQTPMVHWPDNMVTYIPEIKMLLSNDAFGQHIASVERFDDQLGWDTVHEEAALYYANIVLPYGDQVKKALEVVGQLPVEVIGPSHGVIWRSNIPKLLEVYQRWCSYETDKTALIVYDTMWGSTESIARCLREGLESQGIPVTIRALQTSHISEILKDVLLAKAILIGSPTLNNGMLPTVSAFLTYLKGLRPRNRMGYAFGSYGWGGQGAKEVHAYLAGMGWEMPLELTNIQYRPDQEELDNAKAVGVKLAELIKNS